MPKRGREVAQTGDLLQEHLLTSLVAIVIDYAVNPNCLLIYDNSIFLQCDDITQITNSQKRQISNHLGVRGVCAPNHNLLEINAQTEYNKAWNVVLNDRYFACLAPANSNLIFFGSTNDYDGLNEMSSMWDGKVLHDIPLPLPEDDEFDDDICIREERFAVTETDLLCVLQENFYNSGEHSFEKIYVMQLDTTSREWVMVTSYKQDSQVRGLCALNNWIVVTNDDGLEIYNRETKAWRNLKFKSQTHCECFSLIHPIIYDDILLLFPEVYLASGLDTESYDLRNHVHISQEHKHCFKTSKKTMVMPSLRCALCY